MKTAARYASPPNERRQLGLFVGLAALLLTACRSEQPSPEVSGTGPWSDASRTPPPQRDFVTVRWDTLYTIGGSLQDSLLLRPRLIAAGAGLLYAYDYYDHRVKAFDSAGVLRWMFGGDGAGPRELGNPLDLDVAPNGSVWVWDARNQRITVLSPGGEPTRSIPVPGILGKDLTPHDGGAILVVVEEGRFAIVLDSIGEVMQQLPLPLEQLAAVDPVARQTISATIPGGSAWAVAFPMGNFIVVFDDLTVRCAGRLIEATGFPAPGQQDPVWAVAMSATDSSVYVLPRGLTRDALRMLDEYSSRDCSYLRTVRLPGRYITFAVSEGTYFLEHEDPAPTIVALRLRRE